MLEYCFGCENLVLFMSIDVLWLPDFMLCINIMQCFTETNTKTYHSQLNDCVHFLIGLLFLNAK